MAKDQVDAQGAQGKKKQHKKKDGFFDRLPEQVLYSAFGFPGYGQWRVGHKLRAVLILGAGGGLVFFALGKYFVTSMVIKTCPWEIIEFTEIWGCMTWVLDQAWAQSKAAIGYSLLALLGVYLIGVVDAVISSGMLKKNGGSSSASSSSSSSSSST